MIFSISRLIFTDSDHTPSKWFQTPKSGPVGVIKLYSESQGKVADSMSVVYTMYYGWWEIQTAARSTSENNGMIFSRGGRRARGFVLACSMCRERNRGTSCAAGFCSCAWERDSCSVSQDKWHDPLRWWNCYLGHVVILCDLAIETMFCFDGYKVYLFYGTVWGAYGKLR